MKNGVGSPEVLRLKPTLTATQGLWARPLPHCFPGAPRWQPSALQGNVLNAEGIFSNVRPFSLPVEGLDPAFFSFCQCLGSQRQIVSGSIDVWKTQLGEQESQEKQDYTENQDKLQQLVLMAAIQLIFLTRMVIQTNRNKPDATTMMRKFRQSITIEI